MTEERHALGFIDMGCVQSVTRGDSNSHVLNVQYMTKEDGVVYEMVLTRSLSGWQPRLAVRFDGVSIVYNVQPTAKDKEVFGKLHEMAFTSEMDRQEAERQRTVREWNRVVALLDL